MTKREKAALETLTAEERYAASFNRARLDVDRKWLRILLRLAKRAAPDTAVQRAERAVVRAAMAPGGVAWSNQLETACERLRAARAKARAGK